MRLLIIISFILTEIQISAQVTTIDSLQNLVNNSSGEKKVDALNALAFNLVQVDFKKANDFIEEGKRLAEELHYEKGLSVSTIFQGMYKMDLGDLAGGIRLLKQGQNRAKLCGNYGWQGYALTQLGNVYRAQNQYDSAKVLYDQAYGVLKDSLNPWHLAILYKNLSQYYGLVAKPKEEYTFLIRTLAIREKLNDKFLIANALTLLAQWEIKQSNNEEAKRYLTQAERYVEPGSASEAQKEIYYQRAVIYFRESNYNKALQLLNDVSDFYIQNSNFYEYAKSLIDIAKLLEETGNYDISLKNAFEALKVCEEKKFTRDAVHAQLVIGTNYYRINQIASAQQFADKALKIARENDFDTEIASAYSLLGTILKLQKKYNEALFNYEKALEIRKRQQDLKLIAASLSDISQIYEIQGKLLRALTLQKESVTIKESILHQNGLAWGYYDMGSIYIKLKDFRNAKIFLDKAEEKAKHISSGIILVNVYQARRNLLLAQGRLNEALQYSLLYEQLKDSVHSSDVSNRVLSIQSAYELEKKDHEIELLNKSKQLQEDQITIQGNRIQRQQLFIVASVLGLVMLAALAFTLFQYFKKMSRLNKEISAQSEELFKANSSLTALNKDLAEKQEEIQAQSEELTEANNTLTMLNMELAEKHEELTAQSEELSEANSQFVHLNHELAAKQNELEAQSEELRESYDVIAELNESLEQKVRERTREMKQAYKELDTFFYRSSHDFRRPLTTFMGLSEVAKITVKDESALNLFEKVKETAVHLDRMLIKLQSISDVGTHQFVYREVSMQTIFESALDTYQESIDTLGIKVTINVAFIKTFLSYPAFLKIIVENLLENAIQFKGRNDPFIIMSAMEKYDGVEITIQDNGQGVEEQYQDRLFDMFFRGNEQSKGNGLGLYIVKKAVSKLSGTLHLDSKFGEGTTISIWIPLKQMNPE